MVSEEKMFEIVDGRTDDGRQRDWYTISSPMSLRLRWAKKPTDHEPLLFYFPESKNISKSSESEADYLFSTVYSKAIKIAAGL